MSNNQNDHFNPAFENLKALLEKSARIKRAQEFTMDTNLSLIEEDEKYFREAMADVIPLAHERPKHIKTPNSYKRPHHPPPDDVRDTLRHLQGLVKGAVEMDITFTDEYMEGSVKGISPKIMKKLKRGKVRYQDYIDLHGMTRKEAEEKIKEFLISSYRKGIRCVLIIHGRGLNSPQNYPVLKEMLPLWLNRGVAKKIVLAFVTARPYDGGPGAIYVLLRRR